MIGRDQWINGHRAQLRRIEDARTGREGEDDDDRKRHDDADLVRVVWALVMLSAMTMVGLIACGIAAVTP